MIVWAFCAVAAGKSATIVYINGAKYYIHTVQAGETLYGLSKTYGVGEKVILENNPSIARGLKTAENIKIPFVADVPEPKSDKKLRKTFDFHFVSKGETLYAISRQYEIPVKTLLEDNPNLDPLHMRLGERILIRRKQIGSEDEAGTKEQWEEYRQSLNSVAEEGTAYHIVHPGETFYSLSRRFGITEAEFSALNGGLKPADLKAGAMVKIPALEAGQIPEGADSLQRQDSVPETGQQVVQIDFRALRAGDPLDVALLLPLATGGEPNGNYLEFYQGFLLGLDSVKLKYGRSVNVDLYNTARDTARIREIVESDAFRKADLIVGPVYDETFTPVADFAARYGIPAVSPLGAIESADHSLLFQAAPDAASKYDKLRGLFSDTNNVVVISAAQNDTEFQQEILPLLPGTVHRLHYTKGMGGGALENVLSGDKENVIVVLSSDETTTDAILAYISSIQNSLIARSVLNPSIRVVGSSRWARFRNIEKNLFFKLNLRYVTSYHADRGNQRVLNFDRRYIADFGSIPSLYAYRGYDVTKLFVGTVKLHGSNFVRYLNEAELPLLQTPYRFVQKAPGRKFENGEWALVCYNNNYTIEVR